MALTLASAAQLLSQAGLLREIIAGNRWTIDGTTLASGNQPFSAITYDTRSVGPGTLLCCKGQFKAEYLRSVDEKGLAAYVAQTPYSEQTTAPGIIVNDIRKAMSLLSASFYDMPQRELTLVGITGTKGKTTTAYYLHAMLNRLTGGKAALFSSVDNCIDGHTYVESDLTTPESMDALRMMRQAVDHGMRYLVMEVSSQAYKVDRVYGLTFDVGAFLNISPDHISPIEHPTFEDYLYCKRQIVRNSRRLLLNVDCDHADLIRQDALAAHVPVTTFALDTQPDRDVDTGTVQTGTVRADITARPADRQHLQYDLLGRDSTTGTPHHIARLHLAMDGDFNYANAAAAYALLELAVDANQHRQGSATAAQTQIQKQPQNNTESADAHGNAAATDAPIPRGAADHSATVSETMIPAMVSTMTSTMEQVHVSGRMERFTDTSSPTIAIVDYAHNFSSVSALLDFVDERYGPQNPRISLVTGSAGNKAYDRRKEIVQAAEHRITKFFFTVEDTDTEPVMDICRHMQQTISDPTVESVIIDDRAEAIEQAVEQARRSGAFNVVLIIGKGNEQWIKQLGRHIPYEGDDRIVKRLFDVS